MTTEHNKDRLDAWYDGSAICVIAIAANGADPLDLGEVEAEEFIRKLQACLTEAKKR